MQDERIAAALTWARGVLGPVEPQVVKLRPWAATWRIERSQAPDRYLKCSTARTGHEAAVLLTLTEVVPDLVPELVAADPTAHRLVVASAGTVLRDLQKSDTFDLAAWVPLAETFAQLQRLVAPHAGELLAQGVPDERPHRYPQMLRDFSTAAQLPAAMRARLETLADRWETREPGWWRTSTIPVSIQHGDLHDGNVAVDAQGRARFFDFGDSTVAHPFSTMDLPLMFARRAGVDEAGTARLEDAYLDAFTDLAPRAELRAELHGVIELAPLLRARNWLRALTPDEPGDTVRWDPAAADGWGRPIEHWLGQLGSSPRT